MTDSPSARRAALLAWLAIACLPAESPAQAGLSPEEQLASFKLAPGFEVNLFASEADGVANPIQMRWDERGRLWVAGSKVYPQLRPGEEPNDQIVILEDTNGDGRADKSTVFADGLMIPTGLEIAAGDGTACYVGEGTKLWLMTDLDGDGKADRREILLRGFGTGDNHQSINSFRWTPGGELVFCQGLHAFSRVETPWGISVLDQAGLWRYRPREGRLDGFYGGNNSPANPWGWVFTKWAEPILGAGNIGAMWFPTPEMIRGWQGGRRDPIWTAGRGRKTTSQEIVESAHFPAEWQGVLLPTGYINNSVWTLQIERDRSGLRLVDHPSLPPLIQSRHGSFRPIDIKLGPDGALYVADWYNPIIGHYQVSFRHPDRDKTHGRIWRITAKGRPLLRPPPLAQATLPELFEQLRAADRWPREQAKRVLFGKETRAVTAGLRRWYEGLDSGAADVDFALLQALGVFEAHEAVEVPLLRRTLASARPEVRAYAVATLARWAERLPADFGVYEVLGRLARDSDDRVRLAAVVAAGNIPRPESLGIVIAVAEQPRDPFVDTALRAAVAVLKPHWEPELARAAPGWSEEWREHIRKLDRPRPAAPARAVAWKKGDPIVPVHGRLRATPFVQGSVAAEVLARGNPVRGAEVFRRPELACLVCHKVGDEGGELGPRLDSIGSAQPLETMIGMVVEPQRELTEGYEAFRITTKNGDVKIGIIAAGNDAEIVLRDPEGKEHTLAVAEIANREMIGSLMPAGLLDNLGAEDLRDLFAYLTGLGTVK
ncbi:MAG: HEAT repeat domain-containing protein [Verrucomicrobia bacterium]|nr:HEAT repeat domain-containing protein [Verrucomicrobiota bacterium]